ncbi:MAG: hypothetical protein PHS06_01285 [Candidatus Shapirobacteria bacterium]|nr:hypothetical protein [Candidatus Shapirobacteria bacterium]
MKKIYLILLPILLISLFVGYNIFFKQPLKTTNIEDKKEIVKETINDSEEANKQQIIYYAKVKQTSTSGDMRFYWYDTELKQIKDVNNQYAWFFALPEDTLNNNESNNKWVIFIKDNQNSVFKIVGTRLKDDCDYYGPDHCIENINIETIEILK